MEQRPPVTPQKDGKLDLDAFRDWALVSFDGGRSASSVKQKVREIRYLTRHGLDWSTFLSSAAAALQEGERFLAPLVLAGRLGARRHYATALNWMAAWAARPNGGRRAFAKVHFEVPRQARSTPRRLTDDQVERILAYGHRNPFLKRRRRALLWFIVHTGLRRGEIGDIRVEDLDPVKGVLYVGKPRKNGRRREIPLPDEAWSSTGALQAWLRVRHDVEGGWLWTTSKNGALRRMGGDCLYSDDLTDISNELGFRISFTRARHWRGKTLRKARVPLEVIQEAYGHSDPKTTMHYVDDVDAGDMADAYQACGIPGFRSRRRTRARRAAGDRPRSHAGSVSYAWAPGPGAAPGGQQEGRRD